jgi:phospholipid/cholesterol/gamma-HCH transport system substrate-binding protein
VPTPTDLYCKAVPSDPRVVRGARNTPCLNAPGRRGASPSDCLGVQPDVPTPYDNATGRFISPNGGLYLLGAPQEEDLRWQKPMVK